MSDRAIPRSYATLQGFGVCTLRMVNAQCKSRFVRFHFEALKGGHGPVWTRRRSSPPRTPTTTTGATFPRSSNDDFPEFEMGGEVVEEEDEFKVDFDLLDSTKIIPEEVVAVRPFGKLTLTPQS